MGPEGPVQFPKLETRPGIRPWAFQQPKKNRRNAKFMLSSKGKYTNSSEERLSPMFRLEELSCLYIPMGDGLAMLGSLHASTRAHQGKNPGVGVTTPVFG